MFSAVLRLKGSELTSRHWLVKALGGFCRGDPLSAHYYAIYYLTYESGRAEILLLVSRGDVESYALVWYGGGFSIQDVYEVHIWNPTRQAVQQIVISPCERADIQLYNSTSNDVEAVVEHFRSLGFKKFRTEEFYDMVCDRSSFSPSSLEKLAVKLGKEYAPLYRNLGGEQR